VRLIKERINDILISLFNNKNEAGAGGAENDCAPRNAINDFRSASYENKTKNQKNKTALGMASAAHFSGEGHGYVRPGRMCTGYNYIIASATGPGRSLGGAGESRRGDRPTQGPTGLSPVRKTNGIIQDGSDASEKIAPADPVVGLCRAVPVAAGFSSFFDFFFLFLSSTQHVHIFCNALVEGSAYFINRRCREK
jgi:hypothetical protein